MYIIELHLCIDNTKMINIYKTVNKSNLITQINTHLEISFLAMERKFALSIGYTPNRQGIPYFRMTEIMAASYIKLKPFSAEWFEQCGLC